MFIRLMLLAVCLAAALPAGAEPRKCPGVCLEADRAGRSGRYQQALELYAQCLRLPELTQGQRSTAYNNRGNAHYFAQRYDLALRDYDQALRVEPGNALAYFNRGEAYLALDQPDRALSQFDQALKLDPAFARAYYGRGLARLLLKGKWSPEAERDFVLAVSLDSRYVGRMYRDGTRLEKMGFPDRLVLYFGERVLKTAGQVRAYLTKGTEARRQKNYRESIALFERSLAINPYQPKAYYLLGTSRYLLGQDQAALAALDQAIAYDPRHAPAYLLRGKIYLRRGSHEQALSQLNRSLALDPDSSHALYVRGMAHQKRGERARAVADFQRVLVLKPDNQAAAQRLRELEASP